MAANGCDANAGTLTAAGVVIRMASATVTTRDGDTADAMSFCSSLAASDLIEAEGTENGGELLATAIEVAERPPSRWMRLPVAFDHPIIHQF